jgi:hypothetical protein
MRSNVTWRSPAKSGSPELICWVQQANTKQFMFRSEIHGVAGKRHIYTLIFGGGYTDQGEAVLNPIQFDAETTDWVEAANSDVNVKP